MPSWQLGALCLSSALRSLPSESAPAMALMAITGLLLVRMVIVNPKRASLITVWIILGCMAGFLLLLHGLGRVDPFYLAWSVAGGFICVLVIAWIMASGLRVVYWNVFERLVIVNTPPPAREETIAVTLSGGGYRAALTHAGLLRPRMGEQAISSNCCPNTT